MSLTSPRLISILRALTSGPLISTVTDSLAVLTYFEVAKRLLHA